MQLNDSQGAIRETAPDRWCCPACCKLSGTQYRLPLEPGTCAMCGAPVTSDDVGCCSLSGYALPIVRAASDDADGDPIGALREELRHLRATLQELKGKLHGPARVAVSVEEAATMLGCGRTQVFKYLRQGKLQHGKRLGRRATVTIASIEALQAPGPRRKPRTSTPRYGAGPPSESILALLKRPTSQAQAAPDPPGGGA
jgi:hypothetical protein